MREETLLELFNRKKKENKKKSQWQPGEDDKVISKSEASKYKALFNNTVKYAEDVVKSVIKNADLNDDDAIVKEIDKGEYIELYMDKKIVSLPNNFDKFKDKYSNVFYDDNYSDHDGEDLCDWVVAKFLNRFKSKGFKMSEYEDNTFNYVKEGSDDSWLFVGFGEDYEVLSVIMTVFYKKNSLQEGSILNVISDDEPLLELFRRRKENKKNIVEYDAKQVKKEISSIMNDVKKILSKPEYKEVYNHGMSMASLSDTMDGRDPENGKFKSGDNFWIVRFDLHKFPKCDARNYEAKGYKKHPVDEASERLKKEVKPLVEKKYPHYDVDVDGDWDTFALEVVLKNADKNSLQEGSILNVISDDEPLLEVFRRRKENIQKTHEERNPLPRKIRDGEKIEKKNVPVEDVKKAVQDCLNHAKSILNMDQFKEFKNNGLRICSMKEAIDGLKWEDYDEFERGDNFYIIAYDLWDYKGCNAREDNHPVDKCLPALEKELRKYVEKKYDFLKVDNDGDWDTGDIQVVIK